MQINTYLNFNGQCRAAFTFYQQVLGGKIDAMFTHGDTPAAEYVPADRQDMIMHAHMTVGDAVLMGSDAPMNNQREPSGFYVSLHYDDLDEAERVFNALAEEGTVQVPFEETFWAFRFGMLTDRFGIPWMVNCQKPA